jgi:branched-chain amino acid transport system permease protein
MESARFITTQAGIASGGAARTVAAQPAAPHAASVAPWLVVALGVLVLAVFPWLGSRYYIDLAMKIMILAIFALSLELLVGRAGLVSFGHAAFFGIAAYVTALLSPASAPASLWLVLPAALCVPALYALAVGALSLRTRGVYFIMITLAFAQLAYYVFHDTAIGGGSDGIYVNFRPQASLFGWIPFDLEHGRTFYYTVFACLVGTFGLLALLLRSRYGHALAGIRENEQRMRAAGFPTYAYKLGAFVLAAVLAGLAGFLQALKDGYVNPEILSWHQSGAVLLMVILGGIGHLRGAVLGTLVFVLLQEVFQSQALFGAFAKHWQLTLGLTIIACVALLPRGIIGLSAAFARRRTP